MRKVSSLKEELLLKDKKTDELEKMKEDSRELLLPDFQKISEQILSDIQYKGIIARAIGKNFEEREYIGKEDLERFLLLYQLNDNLLKEVEIKILPIMKKGKKWESKESRRLRRTYVKKSHDLFEILSKFSFKGITQSEEILLKGTEAFEKTTAYLDFSSAAAILDKGPRKRKNSPHSSSIFFSEIYVDGVRGAAFGFFDGFDEKGLSLNHASYLVLSFKDQIRTVSKSKLFEFLNSVAQKGDAFVSEHSRGLCGVSATYGLVLGKEMYYVNLGNNTIYGISRGKIEKISGEDVGFYGSAEKMLRELKYPYYYLGAFSQKMRSKKGVRVFHTNFKLKPPHIGKAEISKYDSILIVNDSVWKSALYSLRSEEEYLETILRNAKNPISAVERINMHTKKIMKDQKLKGDVAVLYFSV